MWAASQRQRREEYFSPLGTCTVQCGQAMFSPTYLPACLAVKYRSHAGGKSGLRYACC